MRKVTLSVLILLLLVFTAAGFLAESAQAGNGDFACSLAIGKDAGSSDTVFSFLVEPSGSESFEIELSSGDEQGFPLHFGETAVVSEIVPDGWILANVFCSTDPGLSVIVGVDNNLLVTCLTTGGGVCTFTNLPLGNVPTLSEWGMIAAAAGLGLVGVWFAVRKRRTRTA